MQKFKNLSTYQKIIIIGFFTLLILTIFIKPLSIIPIGQSSEAIDSVTSDVLKGVNKLNMVNFFLINIPNLLMAVVAWFMKNSKITKIVIIILSLITLIFSWLVIKIFSSATIPDSVSYSSMLSCLEMIFTLIVLIAAGLALFKKE